MMLSALLLAFLAVQEPAPAELVRLFLEGNDGQSASAREKLLTMGARSIPPLAAARDPKKNPPRAGALDELFLRVKSAAADDAGKAVFQKLREKRLSVDMQMAPASAVVDYLREITSLNFAIDPAWKADETATTILLDNAPLDRVLGALCSPFGADYDVRYGVILLAPKERLWAVKKEVPEAPLTEEQTKAARAWVAELNSDSPKARDQAAAELRKLGSATIPLLESAAKGGDPETVARARGLIQELIPRPGCWSVLPDGGLWRGQKLEGADLEVARKLRTVKIDLAFESSKAGDILSFVRDFTSLRIDLPAAQAATEITIKVRDLTLGQCLEVLGLPLGLDVRVEKGGIRMAERK